MHDTLNYLFTQFEEGDYGIIPEGEGERLPLMQYTGLKDKNGVEIYEDDLFKSEIHNPSNFRVEFLEGAWCATSPHVEDYPTDMNHFGTAIEVIGNIHENPELLENE
jgi:uncharacterized phage protein (TIGR01671 family)